MAYDSFMDNVPYHQWRDFIHEQLISHNVSQGLVLDLGCGTGTLTEMLAESGYEMIGVDSSSEMLEIAGNKKQSSSHNILYLQQDMREFELYGTVGAVICVCDSINYILELSELKEVFRLVDNYLDPKGVFIFDFNTDYHYQEVIGNQTIAENRKDESFIWENYYYQDERINEIELSLFIRENLPVEKVKGDKKEEDGEIYRKYKEIHHQKAYSLEEIKGVLEDAGLELVDAYDGYGYEVAHDRSQRVVVLARECKK
jgi:SAM-dependent methyltransferase